MKKLLLFMLLLYGLNTSAQTNPITSITISLPPNPDASINKWGAGVLTISAAAKLLNGRIDPRVEGSKILVIIKKGGTKVCGTFTSNSSPATNFNSATKVWSGANAVSLLGQDCTLPPGEYELCVQFFGAGAAGQMPLSEEKCKSFTIKEADKQSYQPPQNVSPTDGTIFTDADLKKPLTFRWTPVIPRLQESVTYRLRVWQLMGGQSAGQAMLQPPLLGNDVANLNQATVMVRIEPSPSDQTLVWNVQALNRDGKPIGGNNGTSEAFKISVRPVNDAPSMISLSTPANNSTIPVLESIVFSWTHQLPSSGANSFYKIKIVEIKGDESPENALRTNKPFFERDSIERPKFQYPETAPYFQSGKTYGWNIHALNREGKPIRTNNGTSEAFTFSVTGKAVNTLTLSLIAPANGATIDQVPTFHWSTGYISVPADYDGDGYYKIRIFELEENESRQACCRNKPHFEKDSLIRPTFQYTDGAPALVKGKRYVWRVSSRNPRNAGMKITESEINEFTIKSMPPPPPCPVINVTSNFSCSQFKVGTSITNTSSTLSVLSWTVSSPNTILTNSSGTQFALGTFMPMTGMPGNFPAINTNQSVNASSIGVQQPTTGATIILIYTFHLSNGQTCQTESMVTWYPNCAASLCACGTWTAFNYKYYQDGVMAVNPGPPTIQAPLTGNAGSITVAQGSRIFPQSGFNCTGNCANTNYRYDFAKVGTPGLLVDHNATYSSAGRVFEEQLDCGDYVLTIYPSCLGAIVLQCPTATIQIHVDCTNPCGCGTWSPVSAKVGNGTFNTVACNNSDSPVPMLASNPISINATLNCIPASVSCGASQQVANIYYANGSLAASNIPLPVANWIIPNPSYTGLLKVELKGKCNTFNCTTCLLYFNVMSPPPPVCTCSWGNIEVGFGIGPQSIATCGQTIQVNPGEAIRVGSAVLNCGFPSCTRSVKADLVGPNGNIILANQNLPLNYTPPAGSCGTFKVVLKGKCGTVNCVNCEVKFYVPCCACTDTWNPIQYKIQGTSTTLTKTCGQTININYGTGLTNITAAYNCNYNSCSKTSPTYKIYGPNSNTTLFMSGNGLVFNFPSTAVCGTYKVVFSGKCGTAVCNCEVFIKVAPACCEYLTVVSSQKVASLPEGSVNFSNSFTISSAVTFDSVKVQILAIRSGTVVKTKANIHSLSKVPVPPPAWTSSQPIALTSPGSGVWFTGSVLAAGPTLAFKGKIVNIGMPINLNQLAIRLRYTFYRSNASCGAMVCEKDINF